MRAKRARNTIKSGRRGAGIVRSGMRQDHRVGLGVRKTEGSAQNVTKLVMERHPDRSEARSTGPGSEQSVGSGIAVGRIRYNLRQRASEGCDALLREIRRDRVSILCVERLHCVGDRVYPGNQRYRWREAVCELHVVYDHLREYLHRADRRLLS